MRFVISAVALVCMIFYFDIFVNNECREGVSKWECQHAIEMSELAIAASRGSREARERYHELASLDPHSSEYKWGIRLDYGARRGSILFIGIIIVANVLFSVVNNRISQDRQSY